MKTVLSNLRASIIFLSASCIPRTPVESSDSVTRIPHVLMNGQRVRADDEVLNAVGVELGKQISEVGVHRIRSMRGRDA